MSSAPSTKRQRLNPPQILPSPSSMQVPIPRDGTPNVYSSFPHGMSTLSSPFDNSFSSENLGTGSYNIRSKARSPVVSNSYEVPSLLLNQNMAKLAESSTFPTPVLQRVQYLPTLSPTPPSPLSRTQQTSQGFGPRRNSINLTAAIRNLASLHTAPSHSSSATENSLPFKDTLRAPTPSESLLPINPITNSRGKRPRKVAKKRRNWTPEEDVKLRSAVAKYNGRQWKKVAAEVGTRCKVTNCPVELIFLAELQCLHRWQKVLNPNVVKGPWSPEEDRKLVSARPCTSFY